MKNKTIIIAGGGTFGHIAPALGLKEQFGENNIRAYYICAKRDRRFPFYETEKNVGSIALTGLPRSKNPVRWIKFLFLLAGGMVKSFFQMLKIKPRAVIATGGFVSFPYVFWAKMFKKPYFLCEQNSFPGLVNRIFAPGAKKVFLTMDDVSGSLKGDGMLTGNPVKVKQVSREKAAEILGIRYNPDKKYLGIVGGSQGAAAVNQWVRGQMKNLEKEGIQVVLSTGKAHYRQWKEENHPNLHVFDFIRDMGAFYSLCDFFISRAGASSISELLYFDKPVIFIPYPHATDNHQYHNAVFAAKYLPAQIVEEEDLGETDLISSLKNAGLSEKKSKENFHHSAERIYQEVIKWI
jgi:UDP-N-acetylglucosamine--N-acetylmuramyl-(pentapeptide) pyrophosphoryl-undecaprenol N-acetylglucosamine transferase